MKVDFIYVPILKWKQGEQGALHELDDRIKDKIIPLVELPTDINLEKLEGTFNRWQNRYFYFDINPEFYEEYEGDIFFELLEKCNPKYVIPVVFPSDNIDAIKQAYNYTKNGIAIRITSSDFENLEKKLIELKNHFDYNNIDLIIDLKEVKENNSGEKKIIVKALLPDIPEIQSFRNIILASSSFPQSLSNFERYKTHYINRYDYQLWNSVHNLENKYKVKLIYSDYCINHPSFFEYIPGMNPSFNIRYTLDNSFMIMRGDSLKKGGLDSKSVISFCEKLINSGNYYGEDYSWGDSYISTRCDESTKNYGNLSTWRKVGTNHHITLVVNQLSNLL